MTPPNALALSLALISSCALGLVSCKKSPGRSESMAVQAVSASTPVPSAATSTRYRRSGAARVVAVGDLHGDLQATEQVLRLAGALGADRHWAGGDLVLVQTGDQLDRGDDEKEILDLIEQLRDEATSAGGAFIALNGNHETMNALGDFRYVTEGAVHDFDALDPDSPHATQVHGELHERAAAFLPGGSMALRLATRPVVVQVGETVFVHGGLKPEHVRYGLDRMNDEVAAFLRGKSSPPAWMVDDDGPLWTRIYGTGELDAGTCNTLAQALRDAGAKRLVIGHTIQDSGISSACDGRVFRIDVGMSSHYRGNVVQALLLRGAQVEILSAQKQ
jgi:hypothetical protein